MFLLPSVILPTEVGEGVYVWYHFLCGCLVPCSLGGDICLWSHVPSRGSLSLVRCSFGGGLCLCSHVPSRGSPWQRPPWTEASWTETPGQRPPDSPSFMVKSGRYASYWNVFLFKKNIANFSETPALYENFTRRIEIPWRTLIFKASHGLKVHNVPLSYKVLQQPLELKFYSEKWIIHFQSLHTPNPTDKLIKIYYF